MRLSNIRDSQRKFILIDVKRKILPYHLHGILIATYKEIHHKVNPKALSLKKKKKV